MNLIMDRFLENEKNNRALKEIKNDTRSQLLELPIGIGSIDIDGHRVNIEKAWSKATEVFKYCLLDEDTVPVSSFAPLDRFMEEHLSMKETPNYL